MTILDRFRKKGGGANTQQDTSTLPTQAQTEMHADAPVAAERLILHDRNLVGDLLRAAAEHRGKPPSKSSRAARMRLQRFISGQGKPEG